MEQNLGNRNRYNKGSTGTPVAEEENSFQVDLRIQGQYAALQDQERLSKIQEVADKLRTGHQTESIIGDLGKKGKFNRFSEESNVHFENREILNCTNWERFPRAFIAKRAYNTHQKDYFRCMHNALAGTEKKD